ncbi:MAG: Tat pathway signal protein [Prevotella sp.]|nr:Tat pathway signal protein [Prevotella sp.]
MQQATINFTASEVRQPVSLRERMRSTGRVINQWLDTKSAFYSRIAEFEVTRRVAIRVNLVTMAVLVVVAAVETAPVAALAAAVSAAWLMYRALEKKGGQA